MSRNVHLNDVGTIFRARIIDCETKLPIDVSQATIMTIKFQKSDLTVVEKDAVFTTDGSDGYIEYITVVDDLDQAGRWKIQGFVVADGFENNSSVEEFKVLSNLS